MSPASPGPSPGPSADPAQPYPPVYPPPPPGAAAADAAGTASPGKGRGPALDPALLAILAATLVGQLLTWGQIEGYRLADSIEYLERAYEVAEGRALDPSTMRSFAFSALLVPLFWIADLLGVEDLRLVVHAARGLQALLGLAAVAVVARTGGRLFGRAGGLACAALLGLNPVFAQYSVSPLSATAALLFVALGVEGLARIESRERATLRRGLTTGLWFGGSILMAFQCIPIAGALLAFAPLRRAWRPLPHLLGLAAGVALALLGALFGLYISGMVRLFPIHPAGFPLVGLLTGPLPLAFIGNNHDDRGGMLLFGLVLGFLLGLLEWSSEAHRRRVSGREPQASTAAPSED